MVEGLGVPFLGLFLEGTTLSPPGFFKEMEPSLGVLRKLQAMSAAKQRTSSAGHPSAASHPNLLMSGGYTSGDTVPPTF